MLRNSTSDSNGVIGYMGIGIDCWQADTIFSIIISEIRYGPANLSGLGTPVVMSLCTRSCAVTCCAMKFGVPQDVAGSTVYVVSCESSASLDRCGLW